MWLAAALNLNLERSVGRSMKRSRDLLWLLGVLAAVALAVACMPYEIPMPRFNAVVQPSPGVFTMLCTGSSHVKAWPFSDHQNQNMPQYFAEVGLVDHR